jgi:pimeloyl-ACP methyl ester carboxylesterase
MAVSDALGERSTVRLESGPLEYRERGTGPPIVFAHGAAVNGDLWRKVAPELADGHRCIAPDLPLGGHSIPLEGLRAFDRPALVAWAADDKFFPREHGRRLAELLPQGRFELVERSRTFIPEDNPGRLVELVRAFL